MSPNLSPAAVVIGALRVNFLHARKLFRIFCGLRTFKVTFSTKSFNTDISMSDSWIQIRLDILSSPILVQNIYQVYQLKTLPGIKS